MLFFHKIAKSKFIELLSLNSLSVFVKIISGLITSKLLAVFVGPSGMGLVGNFRVFFSALEGISTLGFQNGVVKYTAENENDSFYLKKMAFTVSFTLMLVSIIIGILLFCFASYWNTVVFGSSVRYDFVFKVVALSLPWYALSLIWVAVANGLGYYKRVLGVAIAGNSANILLAVYLIYQFKTTGAVLLVALVPAVWFLVTMLLMPKVAQIGALFSMRYFDFKILKSLSSYSIMALFAAVASPFVYLIIRKEIVLSLGLEQAGYWETMGRIASYYMLFVTSIVSIYYFPKLAQAKSTTDAKLIFRNFYQTILPVFIVMVIVIFLCRDFIIQFLFAPNFKTVADLFFLQLLGDIFKVAALILGYQFFAKKHTVAFLVSEFLSLLFLYLSSHFLMNIYGLKGVVMAQALDNFLYFVVLLVYFRKILWRK
ncbi:O-antigen translocase [Flavobacterium sp. F339]|uniref:O-antigen translocase n=1 Tax=Flavobacterium turcicum TaxID=2764718 RepID=A0ABR7JIX9_9FLAO|nr:O-antigen translocase [Flavobacterium turcicum]NHL03180.1 O-antigen translocase [Flavobacterium turcicum]